MRIAVVLAALAAPGFSWADDGLRGFSDGGFYVRADIGAALEADQNDSSVLYAYDYNNPALSDVSTSGPVDVELPSGVSAALGVGWASANSGLRVEGLMIHHHQDGDALGADTDWHTLGFYAAALYDFNSRGRFQPFIGAGAGFNHVEMEVQGLGDESDTRLSVLATAGIGVVLSSSLVGDLTYRYQYTPGLQHAWRDSDPDPTIGFVETTSLATDMQQHAIMAGLRYTMNHANQR